MNPRQTAIAAVRAQLGLSNTPSDWTYDERTKYNKALASYIAANAALFPPQDVEVAQNIQSESISPLGDTSYLADINTFGSAFTDELLSAGEKVGQVGNGVLNGISVVGQLIPFALVGLALVWVLKLKKDIES